MDVPAAPSEGAGGALKRGWVSLQGYLPAAFQPLLCEERRHLLVLTKPLVPRPFAPFIISVFPETGAPHSRERQETLAELLPLPGSELGRG